MPPEWSDLVLTADIPYGEADVLVLHSFHVEPNSGDGGDHLTQLQLVEDGGFTGCVQTDCEGRGVRWGEIEVGKWRKGGDYKWRERVGEEFEEIAYPSGSS